MMNRESKAEVQVTRPGHAFPFGSATVPPHPHINQWCRFSVPERLPLKPFRQDRLNRLPLPPSIMATSKATTNTGAGVVQTTVFTEKHTGDIDPLQKIQLLEKNLAFVQKSHADMLKGLHEEIVNLTQKNKELLFQVVTGLPVSSKEDNSSITDKNISEEQKEKIEKLEKEIKKLRGALKDAVKTNSSLTIQLQQLRSEQQYTKPNSRNKGYSKTPPDSAIDDGRQLHSPCGPSPQMEEYSDTLRQIQRAANHHNSRRDDRYHHGDDMKNDWSDSYMYNGNGYHHHYHRQHRHQMQKSQQHQQPRLPRLPLRNQQNYQHQQYENQYRIRSSNTLPALKQPLVPVMDHRLDKPRKSRGSRAPKMADQVTNG